MEDSMPFLKTALATALVTALALGLAPVVQAQTRGVTDTEIRIGGALDLSGVFAAVSTPAVNGANLLFDQVNAAGGVHGRQIRYIVEDHGYQLPRATQAFNKLIERDEVFAMLLNLGTQQNLAHYPLMERRQVPNFYPLTAARAVLPDPPGLVFTAYSSAYDQIIEGLRYLQGENPAATRVCAMYLPNDFGDEVAIATRDGAAMLGLDYVAETTHRPDEQEFAGALSRLRDEGCQIITQALGVRAAIAVVATASRMGWDEVIFLASSAAFLEAVAQVPGGATEGLHASAGWVDLATRASDPAPAEFITAYEARYGQAPGGFAMQGYSAARHLVMALEAAGPDLTVDSFVQGVYSLDFFDPLLDVSVSFSAENHQGANDVTVSVVRDGAWHFLARR